MFKIRTKLPTQLIRQKHNMSGKDLVNLDAFAARQFDETHKNGNKIDVKFKEGFAKKVNELYNTGKYKLHDGYAPFCKHLFLPNWTGCSSAVIEVTSDNEKSLRSGYQSRRPEELAVLSRWFPKELVQDQIKEAKFLDIILYSREQIKKEQEDLPNKDKTDEENLDDIPYGIISIKAQDEDYETPMQPITVMRNSLGREHGGSGVDLDYNKYNESVQYWSNHAIIQ
ncbi:N-acetyl-gamma-glutamyl-phosphate reductase [Acrasis kona]|uniref:N-acetyl-gamma-glutamyl-phosphate reductase n=1 Tax=Acrasis kona TaxID=1008807 RepID=A0AAW2ZC29_9EUKA